MSGSSNNSAAASAAAASSSGGGNTNMPSRSSSSSSAANAGSAGNGNNTNALLDKDAIIWDMPPNVLQGWIYKSAPLDKEPTKAIQMWKNLETALNSLYEEERPVVQQEQEDGEDEDDNKRKKKKRKQTVRVLHDPYRIWLHAWKDYQPDDEDNDAEKKKQEEEGSHNNGPTTTANGQPPPAAQAAAPSKDKETTTTLILPPEADDVPASAGGKMAHLTLGGIINALSLKPGGVVHKVTPPPGNAKTGITPYYIPSTRLHRAVQARVRADILRTTPLRIQDMLAPELTYNEMNAIRKRIYDTVILGKFCCFEFGVDVLGDDECVLVEF